MLLSYNPVLVRKQEKGCSWVITIENLQLSIIDGMGIHRDKLDTLNSLKNVGLIQSSLLYYTKKLRSALLPPKHSLKKMLTSIYLAKTVRQTPTGSIFSAIPITNHQTMSFNFLKITYIEQPNVLSSPPKPSYPNLGFSRSNVSLNCTKNDWSLSSWQLLH